MEILALIVVAAVVLGLADEDRYKVKPEYNWRSSGPYFATVASVGVWALIIAALVS